ncbi:efflux RND transporter periplasmic adaptor subunit [Nitrospira defluvii]|nr:efflux RND transporter periplasmic adaptor subunit [Nitrospira defluvii]
MFRIRLVKSITPQKTLVVFFLVFGFAINFQAAFAQGRPPAKVVVSSVVNETVQDHILLIGTAESWRTSRVAAEEFGRVEAMLVRRGDWVKKGDILARIGASELLLQLKESEAKRRAARARLERERDNLVRSESLMQENLISEKAYRETVLNVQELEETLAVTAAEQLRFKDRLRKKEVRSPFSGIVTQELIEEGEWLERGGGVVQLVDATKIRILVDMPEKYVSEVKIGGSVKVHFDAIGNTPFDGRVHALIPEGDRASRLFPLEVHVENDDLKIKEGMLAKIDFDLGLDRPVLMVEKDAIIRRGSESFLFIVRGEKAIKQTVLLGKAKGEWIEVVGSLQTGNQVVIRGNERLRDGQAVQIVP